jgi:hypothetical protein
MRRRRLEPSVHVLDSNQHSRCLHLRRAHGLESCAFRLVGAKRGSRAAKDDWCNEWGGVSLHKSGLLAPGRYLGDLEESGFAAVMF